MKISEIWLRELVNPSLTGPELVTQLTMAGLEVDAYYPVAGAFTQVVVAQVVETEPHPKANKLTLCKVDYAADKLLDIVCGAANVRSGLIVALALPGSELPGGICIKESVLRGQVSQGMLCSEEELGLEGDSEGIMELADDAPIGMDLREYLQLDDHVFDIDLTPNRADCFSHLGVAREVAALNGLPAPAIAIQEQHAATKDKLKILVQSFEACPQYCGRIIKKINTAAMTPVWMKERLRRCGIRPKHPIVDITNYVMIELGQPLHAFDLNKITGSISVRYAHEKETIVLLDGQEVILTEQDLIIADEENPLALAGIMGGEASSVQEDSNAIFLESAFFDPRVIAGAARKHTLTSDASQRFERGVDPALHKQALERATELVLRIMGGKAGPIHVANKAEILPHKEKIQFAPSKVKQITGIDIPEIEMRAILNRLGMNIDSEQDKWIVTVPTYRFDIELEVDLVEEVIRLYGYNNIDPVPIESSMRIGKTNTEDSLQNQVAMFFANRGFYESISYSFVDPVLQQALYPETNALQLINPISSELSVMRIGMWPGLLATMMYNAHRQQSAIKLFEIGVVFDMSGEELQERKVVGGLITGEHGGLNWSEVTRNYDFFDLKGDLEALFSSLKRKDIQFVPAIHPALHPGQSARIQLKDKNIGWIGALHPKLLDELDHNNDILLFELAINELLYNKPPCYKPISKYPQIRRDLSFLVENKVTAGAIKQAVMQVTDPKWLKSFDVFDVYRGEHVPANKKSVAIALTLQDDNRTLVDTEINTLISAIIKKLDDEFAIILRD